MKAKPQCKPPEPLKPLSPDFAATANKADVIGIVIAASISLAAIIWACLYCFSRI